MRSVLKKLLVVLLIILTLNNFLLTSSFAVDPPQVNSQPGWVEILVNIVGSIIGLFTFLPRIIALGAAWGINLLTASVAYIEGTTENAGDINTSIITPYDIFFNKVKILDINFFDIGTDDSIVTQIRTSVAVWFYVLRNVAAAILLVVFIYVGIRMALSTIASEKALYKKMLVDWIVSILLIFIIQYIIIFAVTLNSTILKAIEFGVSSEKITNTYGVIRDIAFKIDIDSIAATVVFCMLVWQTLGLVISYFNRMLKIAFLIIISPLITLTYSIDKMGDGKAQALGAWLKEFIYTILIQPFHCIVYMCFIDVALNLLINNTAGGANNNVLGVAVVSILCVHFVKEAEKLIRKIFAFKDDNSSTAMTAGLAIASGALMKSKSIGKGARRMVNGVRGTTGALAASVTGAKIGSMARQARREDRAQGINEDKSLDEYKEEARIKYNSQKAQKLEQKYHLNSESKEVMAEVKNLKKAMPEINPDEAKSIARINVAKRYRSNKGIRKPFTSARGVINKVSKAANSSVVLKGLSSYVKGSVSLGMGVMVGSGIYGTNGNFGTALAGGAAMYSGTQAFQKTAATLERDINGFIKGAGGTDKESAVRVVNDVMANSAIYEKGDQATEKMKEIMENLARALEKANVDTSNKNKIRNMLERGIKANPEATQQVIKNAIGSVKDRNGNVLSVENNALVAKATSNLAEYINKREIYSRVQQAADFNITPDKLLGGAINRLPDRAIGNVEDYTTADNSSEIVETTMEKVDSVKEEDDVTTYIDKKTELDEYIEDQNLNDRQIQYLESEFESRIAEMQDYIYEIQLEETEENKGEHERKIAEAKKQIDDIRREQIDTISRAIAQEMQKPDRTTDFLKELRNKYEDELTKKIQEYVASDSNTDLDVVHLERLKETHDLLIKNDDTND